MPGKAGIQRNSQSKGGTVRTKRKHTYMVETGGTEMKNRKPSIDVWLEEAKAAQTAAGNGMYLIHNGVVRETPRAAVREGRQDLPPVTGMDFSYDPQAVEQCIQAALQMEGISQVKVWLNEGRLCVGDDIMLVLIGGDIRPHVVNALQYLVGRIKKECVKEKEIC